MDDVKLLKKLYKSYGDKLLDELAIVTLKNGQGDCYECRCSKYCNEESCFNAIKHVMKDILEDNNG